MIDEPLETEKVEKILLELNKTGLSYLKYRSKLLIQFSSRKPSISSKKPKK